MELQEFGAHLRKLRKDMHMTQAELADELGIQEKEVSRNENGVHEMKGMAYARLLELHAERIMKEEDNMIRKFRKLSPAKQEAIMQMIEAMSD